ncbi:MAG: tRNA adenosine(34) deaminase TadA [Lachnospiraceae bacterium]|nr:tRNA adenosine(34) deaminase TadA [Lachnospiraceae bacterium]
MLTEDEKYMREALKLAEKAAKAGEVPIGCVIVCDGKVIGRGYNRRNTDHSTLSHAEMTAIKKASTYLKDWRLDQCTMYVTLEPCQMCAGAAVQARIPKVVIGCMSPKSGSAGTVANILNNPAFTHSCEIVTGVLSEECSTVLKNFFIRMRAEKRALDSAYK